jgi:two-component system invasion response regulator UvrY
VTAVQEVAKGKIYISTGVAQKIAMQSLDGGNEPVNQLSAREFEVFRMVAEGLGAEEVAYKLKISQKTVANYLTLIKQKLGVSTPIEMLRLAMRHGMIEK